MVEFMGPGLGPGDIALPPTISSGSPGRGRAPPGMHAQCSNRDQKVRNLHPSRFPAGLPPDRTGPSPGRLPTRNRHGCAVSMPVCMIIYDDDHGRWISEKPTCTRTPARVHWQRPKTASVDVPRARVAWRALRYSSCRGATGQGRGSAPRGRPGGLDSRGRGPRPSREQATMPLRAGAGGRGGRRRRRHRRSRARGGLP